MNTTALNEYLKELNSQANLREILINFLINLTITSANSIKLQSLSLIQLTQPTNQLTRTTLVRFLFLFKKFNLKNQIDAGIK
jgi:hypothetical protein